MQSHQIGQSRRGCQRFEPARRWIKSFSPADIEARIYARWEAKGYFAPSGARSRRIPLQYRRRMSPARLHMGHAFQDTVMDALIRYHRMRGFNTLWQPGTDHAGIATQMVVERQLNAVGPNPAWISAAKRSSTRSGSGRRPRAASSRSKCAVSALPSIGNATDFTMDPGLSQAVTEVFVKLYDGRPDLPRQTSGQLGSGA